MNRFNKFTDDELYILKRQAIEGSYNIVCIGRYSRDEIKLHTKLMNEIIEECSRRDYQIQINNDYKSHY